MQRMIRKISGYFSKPTPVGGADEGGPVIMGRNDHHLSRKQLDKAALDVLYGLKRAGYDAYLVGGGVRDLLLGLEPKDFDVVTNAEPEQIKKVFKRQCRLIGRRFRLAHVQFGRTLIEVATFRGEGEGTQPAKRRFGRKKVEQTRQVDNTGRLVRDNIYGTIEEDVWRRDFTINSLYYNIKDFSIVDYTGALEDIEAGVLRLIGDPTERYREDPVRMIRAVRFSAKLGFSIEPETEAPIFELGHLLHDVSNARLFEEVLKLFHSGVGVSVLEKLKHYDLFKHLFPLTHEVFQDESDHFPRMLVIEALKSTDIRIQDHLGVNPAFLFSAMLWEPMLIAMDDYLDQGYNEQDAMHAATDDVLSVQIKSTAIPKRFTAQMREIWGLQFRLPKYCGAKAYKLREHPRFRAAYDFMGIRLAAGEVDLEKDFNWWTDYQEKNPVEQVAYAHDIHRTKPKRKPRRNRNPFRGGKSHSSKYEQSS